MELGLFHRYSRKRRVVVVMRERGLETIALPSRERCRKQTAHRGHLQHLLAIPVPGGTRAVPRAHLGSLNQDGTVRAAMGMPSMG